MFPAISVSYRVIFFQEKGYVKSLFSRIVLSFLAKGKDSVGISSEMAFSVNRVCVLLLRSLSRKVRSSPTKKWGGGGWGETTRSSDYGLQQVAKTLLNWPVARFSTTASKFLAIGLEISGRTRLTTLTEITGISDNETLLYQGPSTYTY